MTKLLIFSGTSEGRQFTELVNSLGINTVVFVATEYGEVVMHPDSHCEIRQGRLTPAMMEEVFKTEEYDYIVDSTHPHAVEVTANIKKAAVNAGVADKYIRISRDLKRADDDLLNDYPDIEIVNSVYEAIDKLQNTEGRILLTTGVKELSKFASCETIKDRLVARMLPSMESLTLAYQTEVKPAQIIAMEGPFGVDINNALIKQYDIKILVTKNSGRRGGFTEKLESAKQMGVHTICIELPSTENGLSVEGAVRFFAEKIGSDADITELIAKSNAENAAGSFESLSKTPEDNCPASNEAEASSNEVKPLVSIVGVGMGNVETITCSSRSCIENADVLIGAKRMAAFASSINAGADVFEEYYPEKVLEIIESHKYSFPVVLMSGDTGFHSGAYGVAKLLKKNGYESRLYPGISSLSYFASKIGVPYSEAAILSLHAQEADLETAMGTYGKFFCILSGYPSISEAYDRLRVIRTGSQAEKVHVYVGFNLGQPDEEITQFMLSDALPEYTKKGLYIMAVSEND